MGDYKKDSEKGNSIDCLFPELKNLKDEDLLKEFESSVRLEAVPQSVLTAPSYEFESIWSRIQDEKVLLEQAAEFRKPVHNKVIRGRFGWKRLAAIGLIACLLAGSGCIVAMGTKSYFFREVDAGAIEGRVFVNDFYNDTVNGEEEAYALVGEQLGIEPLKLGFIPEELEFLGVEAQERRVVISFLYHDDVIYFIQSKDNSGASLNHDSDAEKEPIGQIRNKWLGQNLDIQKEELSDGRVVYEMTSEINGVYYSLSGLSDRDIFEKMVGSLSY